MVTVFGILAIGVGCYFTMKAIGSLSRGDVAGWCIFGHIANVCNEIVKSLNE